MQSTTWLVGQVASQVVAQNNDAEAAGLVAGALAAVCCIFLVYFGILAVICWLVSDAVRRVPQEHRLMSPGMVWLLLIPLFNIVWAFFVFQKVPESIDRALRARGITDAGDCGKRWGLVFAILNACNYATSFIPFVGFGVGLAALVFLILAIVSIRSSAARLTPQ